MCSSMEALSANTLLTVFFATRSVGKHSVSIRGLTPRAAIRQAWRTRIRFICACLAKRISPNPELGVVSVSHVSGVLSSAALGSGSEDVQCLPHITMEIAEFGIPALAARVQQGSGPGSSRPFAAAEGGACRGGGATSQAPKPGRMAQKRVFGGGKKRRGASSCGWWEACSAGARAEVLAHPAQVVINASQVHWTAEVAKGLSGAKL